MAKKHHDAIYQDLLALIKKHAPNASSLDVLAVAAHIVGKLVAMQDQRTVTSELATQIISANIESGNQEMLKILQDSKPGIH